MTPAVPLILLLLCSSLIACSSPPAESEPVIISDEPVPMGTQLGPYTLLTRMDHQKDLHFDRVEYTETNGDTGSYQPVGRPQIRVSPWGNICLLANNANSRYQQHIWFDIDPETGSFTRQAIPTATGEYVQLEDFAVDRSGVFYWIEVRSHNGEVPDTNQVYRLTADGERELVLSKSETDMPPVDYDEELRNMNTKELFIGPNNEVYVGCYYSALMLTGNPYRFFRLTDGDWEAVPGEYERVGSAGLVDNQGNYHWIWEDYENKNMVWQITDLTTGERTHRDIDFPYFGSVWVHWADPAEGIILQSYSDFIRYDAAGKVTERMPVPRSLVAKGDVLLVDGNAMQSDDHSEWMKTVYRYEGKNQTSDRLYFNFPDSIWNMQGNFLLRDLDADGQYYFENMGWMMAYDNTQRAVFDADQQLIETAFRDSIPIHDYHSLNIFDDFVWAPDGKGYLPLVTEEGFEVWRIDALAEK